MSSMNKKAVLTKDLFNIEEPSYMKEFFAKYEYPWQMLPDIKKLIAELTSFYPKKKWI